MLSRILYIPFALATMIALYLTLMVSSDYSFYIIPPFMILTSIFFIQPEIDWWWYKKHPPVMNPKLEQIIRQTIPFYAALPPDDQKRFRDRVELYVIANAFIAKGAKEDGVPPEDVRYFVATCICQLTFGREDFRLPKFERIVIYPMPFPSPQFPTHIHSSEIFPEDGVLIFAVRSLMEGILQAKLYNVGLHEYAQAFIYSYPEEAYAQASEVTWEQLETISGFSQKKIEESIGLPEVDIRAVVLHHFLNFPKEFQAMLPDLYARHCQILNLDRLREGSPVIKKISPIIK